jgi:HD-GYP domain-containing protein (c-di-GMP phosphodiesterase class II)
VAQPLPAAYRAYCVALAAAGALAGAGLLLADGLTVDLQLAVVLLAAGVTVAVGTVADGERAALSLVHLPVLAAAFVCSPAVAPAVGAALAAIDNRAWGRWVVMSNAGSLALSATAAVGALRLAEMGGAPADPGDPIWFFAGAAAALAFFLVNHLLVVLMITLKYGEPPLATWRGSLLPMAGADIIGSTILVAFVGLGASVEQTAHRAIVALLAILTVGLLLAMLEAARRRDLAVSAKREADAAREDALQAVERARHAEERAHRAEQRALERAESAADRLHDVATGTVLALVAVVDLKDRYTARHSASVGRLCRLVATELGWSPEERALAHVAGLVHDIGKIGIPDALLRKPGRPTDEEWALLRRHPDWGADALSQVAFTAQLVEGVRGHHERWNGSGYPAGTEGADIPMLARMVALCDTFDAMTSRRPFRPAMTHDVALQEIARGAGVLFDPGMTPALLRVVTELDPLDWALGPADFADEWRRACIGIDMGRLYVGTGAAPLRAPSEAEVPSA